MTRGMILAAGRGVRLSLLTDVLPKPLLPVANKPVMVQGVGCLRRAGIDEICANVSYRAEQIMETFGDGQQEGVRLYWSVEDEPSGTAGGLKSMQHRLGDGRVVVIAGDAMLDVDLAPLIAAHVAHGAFATLGTISVDDPSPYGVVVTDNDSRILRFQEKPLPGTEISHQVNTGIYIFEPGIFDMIPEKTFCDFALQRVPGNSSPGPAILRLSRTGLLDGYRQPGRIPARQSGFPRRADRRRRHAASMSGIISSPRRSRWKAPCCPAALSAPMPYYRRQFLHPLCRLAAHGAARARHSQ